jgi:23S rRNA (adenine2030-N6)-methyltransferase
MELHSTDYGQLRGYLAGDKRVALHQRDGHEGVVALLPPSTGRGLILIDPSYERKGEYRQVVESLCAMRHRWSNALVMIWYPLLPGAPQRVLLDGLVERAGAPVYRLELEVAMPGSRGMYGCGLAIVRPPWRLPQRWPQLVQSLAERLSPNGRSRCEWLVSEEMLSG